MTRRGLALFVAAYAGTALAQRLLPPPVLAITFGVLAGVVFVFAAQRWRHSKAVSVVGGALGGFLVVAAFTYAWPVTP